jgi:C4-type Zn-finger protein
MRKPEISMATLLDSKVLRARVYCPICTHTVEAEVVALETGYRRKMKVIEGQKCRRCSAALDAAYILDLVAPLNG